MEDSMKSGCRWVPVLLLGLVPFVNGCGPAVAAGAVAGGAAAGLAYSDRGAQSYVTQTVQQVAKASVDALRAMNIAVEEREAFDAEDNEIEIKAREGGRDVVVDIEGNRDAGRTHIEVTVSEDFVNYDRDRADQILRQILKRLE
jgi:hypothetical protein